MLDKYPLFRWLTKMNFRIKYPLLAEVAELADALRSGRSGHNARGGSNPPSGTKTPILILLGSFLLGYLATQEGLL